MGDRQYGIDPVRFTEYAAEIKKFTIKAEIAIVIGGGIF
jgi:uridylate kinase